jgi:hypothetical protein
VQRISFLSELKKPSNSDSGFIHLAQLQGCQVIDIARIASTNPRADAEYGLVLRSKIGSIRTAWIMADPEGNSSGHLDIVRNK